MPSSFSCVWLFIFHLDKLRASSLLTSHAWQRAQQELSGLLSTFVWHRKGGGLCAQGKSGLTEGSSYGPQMTWACPGHLCGPEARPGLAASSTTRFCSSRPLSTPSPPESLIQAPEAQPASGEALFSPFRSIECGG